MDKTGKGDADKDKGEIARLISSASEEGAVDDHAGHRAAPRFAAGMQLDVSTDPAEPSRIWPVIMHNISDGGFAFWSKQQLWKDDAIWVRAFSSDNSAPWLPAHVTHRTVGIRGYLIGAQFDTQAEND